VALGNPFVPTNSGFFTAGSSNTQAAATARIAIGTSNTTMGINGAGQYMRLSNQSNTATAVAWGYNSTNVAVSLGSGNTAAFTNGLVLLPSEITIVGTEAPDNLGGFAPVYLGAISLGAAGGILWVSPGYGQLK
jgi:hypothetical protein